MELYGLHGSTELLVAALGIRTQNWYQSTKISVRFTLTISDSRTFPQFYFVDRRPEWIGARTSRKIQARQ